MKNRTKNNHIAYKESKERFLNHTEDTRVGFCNWEVQHVNFKLECWNIRDKNGKVEPRIFQIWKDGNGFSEYRPC